MPYVYYQSPNIRVVKRYGENDTIPATVQKFWEQLSTKEGPRKYATYMAESAERLAEGNIARERRREYRRSKER